MFLCYSCQSQLTMIQSWTDSKFDMDFVWYRHLYIDSTYCENTAAPTYWQEYWPYALFYFLNISMFQTKEDKYSAPLYFCIISRWTWFVVEVYSSIFVDSSIWGSVTHFVKKYLRRFSVFQQWWTLLLRSIQVPYVFYIFSL